MLMSKKASLKCIFLTYNHIIREDFLVSVYFINNELKFIEDRDSNVIPTLRILHVYPFMMPHMQCDKGAIKHIMSGSDVMCPGLTSPGGKMADVPKDTVVAITAEGKEHAMGIGITTMSAKDIKNINKNVGIKLIMNLTDGMWKLTRPQITL
jgi:malignant T-cell-amplified sequence